MHILIITGLRTEVTAFNLVAILHERQRLQCHYAHRKRESVADQSSPSAVCASVLEISYKAETWAPGSKVAHPLTYTAECCQPDTSSAPF